MWITYYARALKRWWLQLLLPPKPSPVVLLFLNSDIEGEGGMAHSYRALIALPVLRQDEIDFKDEHDSGIVARHLLVTINDTNTVDQQVPVDMPQFTVPGIPAGSTVIVNLSNVLADGHEGLPVSRIVTAPSEPKPIPLPDHAEVTFEAEEHEHE
jgi:hypothetical protein